MKGYKAFQKGLICNPTGNNPFQYAENTVFEQEQEAAICNSGFHFCKNPLDVLDYYPLVDNNGNITEFAEVEALDDCKTDDNKKFCTKKIKIGAKISFPAFIKASFSVAYENIKNEVAEATKDIENGGDGATLAGGDEATLAGGVGATLAGDYGATLAGGVGAKLAGGYGAKLAGGNYAKLAGGDGATLAGDYGATLAGGVGATLAGGNYAKLAGGNYAKLAGGDGAKLAGGNYATLAGGENSLIVGDNGSVAKGKKGTVILLVERDDDLNIINYSAVQVDGINIKEDVLYKLEDGEIKELKKC